MGTEGFDEVTEILARDQIPDLEGHYASYAEGPGRTSVEGFLEYLYARKLLSEQRYRALHIRGTPVLTFDQLLARGIYVGVFFTPQYKRSNEFEPPRSSVASSDTHQEAA